MDCVQIEQEELLERYVSEQLSEAGRDAVEEHYFGCDLCHEHVQMLRAVREELVSAGVAEVPDRPGWNWVSMAPWLAAAAGLIVGALLWLHSPPPAPSSAPTAQHPRAPEANLAELAKLDPPAYRPVVLRDPAGAVDQRFRAGMKNYVAQDYAAASRDLREAQKLAGNRADITFFLGVSELLSGDTEAAILELRKAIALGDSAFLEEAHFCLAKAYLRMSDPRQAMPELVRVAELKGEHAAEAERLLQQLRRLDSGSQ